MPQVLILRAPGTNCDKETAYAFQLAGATRVDVLHVNRVLESPETLKKAQIVCIPGGFSFGDDVAAGKIFAAKIRNHLAEAFATFRDAGKLILGICNGFQVLVKSGLIFPDDAQGTPATLTWNSSGMYTDRWVHLKTVDSVCVFLPGIQSMYLPIAHAEGRFVPRNADVLKTLDVAKQLPLRYEIDGNSNVNPNGSTLGIAGACDKTGRVFGLMPHPERHIDAIQHPHWTRMYSPGELRGKAQPGDGLALFRNAVSYFQ